MVQITDSYAKQFPPGNPNSDRTLDKMERDPDEGLPIVNKMTIINFHTTDTLNMIVGLTLDIKMEWNDSRLAFKNLMPDSKTTKIPLAIESTQKLWIPLDFVEHENVKIDQVSSINYATHAHWSSGDAQWLMQSAYSQVLPRTELLCAGSF